MQPLNYVVSQYACVCNNWPRTKTGYTFLLCVCAMKLNVLIGSIPNVCYAVNACGRVSRRGQWEELDLGGADGIYSWELVRSIKHKHMSSPPI